MNRIVFALLASVLGFTPLQAQIPGRQAAPPGAAGNGEVVGSVLDAERGEPLYGASVAVMSREDAAVVSGDIAHQDGAFRVQGLPPGTYYLQVSSIGYE